MLAAGTKLQDRYEIESFAAKGGMGSVYRARDTQLGRVVAIKGLNLADGDAPALQEARALAAIRHQNIISVFDIVRDQGQFFIVTEWIDGQTLAEIASPVHPALLCSVLVQVVSGLNAIHEAGLVHRDIKPSNIMIAKNGRVCLIDFGVAFATGGAAGHTIAGTLRYTDPRILSGEGADQRSDYFSLGIIAAELATGHALVPNLAPIPMYRFFISELWERVRLETSRVFPPLRKLILWCLRPKREDHLIPDYLSSFCENMRPNAPQQVVAQFLYGSSAAALRFDDVIGCYLDAAIKSESLGARDLTDYIAFRDQRDPAPKASKLVISKSSVVWALAFVVTCACLGIFLFSKNKPQIAPTTPAFVSSTEVPVIALEPVAKVPVEPPKAPKKKLQAPKLVRVPAEIPVEKRDTPAPVIMIPVTLTCNVWADVYVDGTLVGRLPRVRPFEIAAGSHRIALVNPFTERLERTILVEENTGVAKFHFILEKKNVAIK